MKRAVNVIVVEDEPNALEFLCMLLDDSAYDMKIVATATNVQDAIARIDRFKPDLVFLDIQMPDGSGFDVIEKSTFKDYKIIFSTAYEQHALAAFKVHAIDYILKPVNPVAFNTALEIAVKQIFTQNPSISPRNHDVDFKLQIPTGSGYEYLRPDQVLYLMASDRYSVIYAENGKVFTVAKTLKLFEEELSEYGFFRSHKSFLVNLDFVSKLARSTSWLLEMKNGTEVSISRTKIPSFKKLIRSNVD